MLIEKEQLQKMIAAKEAQIKQDMAALKLQKHMLKATEPRKAFVETAVGRGLLHTLSFVTKPMANASAFAAKVISDPAAYRREKLYENAVELQKKYETKKPEFKGEKDNRRTLWLLKLMDYVCQLEVEAKALQGDEAVKFQEQAAKLNAIITIIRPPSADDAKKLELLKSQLGPMFSEAIAQVQAATKAVVDSEKKENDNVG